MIKICNMEEKYFFIQTIWTALVVHLVLLATAASDVTTTLPQMKSEEIGGYAWSSWGTWSPCSKPCGGGVAVQKRQCLPRPNTAPEGSLPTPLITVRVTRQVQEGDCQGIAERYHECNTAPCSGGVRDKREEQCAAYDRRPFRGRFYTWVPYIDGASPCTLNCRPLGQHFYASLALVADGTPCTRPGFRAICVQGSCKVVGRSSVVAAASSAELACGRRLVSGLFSRPRLPLGYSYVTTVPRGACRLNVSEIMPTENYIALKISNGSFIVNGEFAISTPGTYDAAGARFIYSRQAGLDSITAIGPIRYPIDIMILYTQPNPAIKYEYFTQLSPGEIETQAKANIPEIIVTSQPRHMRRHHGSDPFSRPVKAPKYPDFDGVSREVRDDDDLEENVIGGRRFLWKIMSYTQCTRSCGGGIQLGKYRCVEASPSGDREVSSVHCSGAAPAARRRRCGLTSCPPRWRSAAWSQCPTCGPATRTRIVGCVQDHSKGIIKVSDQKCPTPKPPTTDICNVPDCIEEKSEGTPYIEDKRNRPRDQIDSFREGPVYSVTVDSSDLDVGPEYSISPAVGWLYTEWSECVGWCVGEGVQTRRVRCADPSGCAPRKSLDASRSCKPILSCGSHEGRWFTGDWSACTSSCGGKQVRGVLCIGGSGRHLRDTACKAPKPESERNCEDECSPTWFFGDWSQCKGNCSSGAGEQTRTVWCANKDDASDEAECDGPKPQAQRTCSLHCSSVTPATIPPDLTIESQRDSQYVTSTTAVKTTTMPSELNDCEDTLRNCALAVQARLCHYKYYIHNCCHSCRGR